MGIEDKLKIHMEAALDLLKDAPKDNGLQLFFGKKELTKEEAFDEEVWTGKEVESEEPLYRHLQGGKVTRHKNKNNGLSR